MDWVSLLSAIGFSGIVTAIVGTFQNRRINRATADSSVTEYTTRIIEQSDARVKQTLDDRVRAFQERDEAYAEAKEQRRAKQQWREKFYAEQRSKHEIELKLKDVEAELQQSEWFRCETIACTKRVPPRKEE